MKHAGVFLRTLEAAGIDRVDGAGRKIDIHALRHTAATQLARTGVGMAEAQNILRHASIEMTAKVYTHLDVEDLCSALDGIDGSRRSVRSLSETA